jgi:hypothetical protein
MADLDSFASPLSHSKHQRYRRAARVRHSRQFEEFLIVQAARLSTTTAAIFALLDTNTADMIRAASTVGALHGEPAGH